MRKRERKCSGWKAFSEQETPAKKNIDMAGLEAEQTLNWLIMIIQRSTRSGFVCLLSAFCCCILETYLYQTLKSDIHANDMAIVKKMSLSPRDGLCVGKRVSEHCMSDLSHVSHSSDKSSRKEPIKLLLLKVHRVSKTMLPIWLRLSLFFYK